MKWNKVHPQGLARVYYFHREAASKNVTLQTTSVAMGIIPADKREGSEGEINAVGLCGWLARRSVIRPPGHEVRGIHHGFEKERGASEKRRGEGRRRGNVVVCVRGGMNHLWGYFEARRTSVTIISSCSLKERSQLEMSHSPRDVPIHDTIQIVSKEALLRGKMRFTRFPDISSCF